MEDLFIQGAQVRVNKSDPWYKRWWVQFIKPRCAIPAPKLLSLRDWRLGLANRIAQVRLLRETPHYGVSPKGSWFRLNSGTYAGRDNINGVRIQRGGVASSTPRVSGVEHFPAPPWNKTGGRGDHGGGRVGVAVAKPAFESSFSGRAARMGSHDFRTEPFSASC
jgi:hypothetical protein